MFENERYMERELDVNKEVEVYRNLTYKCLSIVQNGLVVARVQKVTLKDVTFHISLNGYQKFLESGHKNVHSKVKGFIIEGFESDNLERVYYNPKTAPYFRHPNPNDLYKRIDECQTIEIHSNGFMQALI